MPKFSQASLDKLSTCHPDLQRLFKRVVLSFDCTVLEGVRSRERQQQMVNEGKSKTLNSLHLKQLSGHAHAVDIAPYPVDWEDKETWYAFGGFVRGLAESMEINVRWGGDWNGDWNVHDQAFVDLPHWEIK